MKKHRNLTQLRLASMLLVFALILLPALASCTGNEKKPVDNPVTDAVTDKPSVTEEPVTTEADESKLSVAEKFGKKDFKGATLLFLTGGDTNWWVNYDISGPVESGETLSEALYRRNSEIEEAFGCVILHEQQSHTAAGNAVQKDVTAGDGNYDSYFCNGTQMSKMISGKLVANLNEIDGFNFSDIWWNDTVNKNLNFGGKYRLFAMGDMNIMAWKTTACLMYNFTLGNQLGIENLYDVVKSGKWTVDKWIELVSKYTLDFDNDGKLNYDKDRYGLVCGHQLLEYTMNAMGETFAAYDEDNWPVVFTMTERTTEALEKLTLLFSKENTLNVHDASYSGGQSLAGKSAKLFSEGRFLFFAETIGGSFQLWDMPDNYGFLPFPKFNEEQENYISSIQSNQMSIVTIPAMSFERLDETVAVINAMGFKNHYEIKSVFFDAVFGTRSVRDPESYEMLEIILGDRTFDLGVSMNFGSLVTELRNVCISGTNGFASIYRSLFTSSEKDCEKLMSSLKNSD